ncbi:MAG: exodeoxyribonuclease VII large subunit, partial [Candidatus Dormiibacterota bacterium]
VQQRRLDLARRRGPERLRLATVRRLAAAEQALAHRRERLAALSPDGVLARGYSIAFDAETGTVLRRSEDTGTGRAIRVRLAEGGLRATVEELEQRDDQS